MLNRQPHSAASKDSDTDSSDYASADEDLCVATLPGEQHRNDGKPLAQETSPQGESSCSYGRLGILAHVVKGLQRCKQDESSVAESSVTTPTRHSSDVTAHDGAQELQPHAPDATVRWEDPVTGKVHYLDKVLFVCRGVVS